MRFAWLVLALCGCFPDIPDASTCLAGCRDDVVNCLDDSKEIATTSCLKTPQCALRYHEAVQGCFVDYLVCAEFCIDAVEEAF